MKNTIIDSLRWRGATKKFDTNKTINEATLSTLLETARLAPTSYGLDAWKLILVSDSEMKSRLCLAAYGQPQVKEAPHLLVLAHDTRSVPTLVDEHLKLTADIQNIPTESLARLRGFMMADIERRSPAEVNHWLVAQTYIVLGFLLETAALLKIDACPLEGFRKDQADEIMGLAAIDLTATILLPIGYRTPDDTVAARPKVRRPLEKMLLKI